MVTVNRFQTKAAGAAMITCSIVLLFSPITNAEFERGRALYENHCRFCHESWAHKRPGNRITSIHSLRQRVAAWSVHSGLGWGEEEIDDVTDYMSRHYFRLDTRP